MPEIGLLTKTENFEGSDIIPRKAKECHLFYGIGDDEIQIDSFDKKLNGSVLNLAEKEPGSVYIIDDNDKPFYLRAAVKMTNLSIQFQISQRSHVLKTAKDTQAILKIKNIKNERTKQYVQYFKKCHNCHKINCGTCGRYFFTEGGE